MTIRLCKMCRDWHDVEAWPAECVAREEIRAGAFPTPRVMSDSIPPTVSQIDGKTYDSKSRLFSHYRDHGAHVVPKGYRADPPQKAPVRPALERAFAKAGI